MGRKELNKKWNNHNLSLKKFALLNLWYKFCPCNITTLLSVTLTHLSRMGFLITINWRSPFPSLGVFGGIYRFYSNFNWTICKQTVETLIRRHVLRTWRLIWVCTVCLCPIKRTLSLYGLIVHVSIKGERAHKSRQTQFLSVKLHVFPCPSILICVFDAKKRHFNWAVLWSTHNIFWLRKQKYRYHLLLISNRCLASRDLLVTGSNRVGQPKLRDVKIWTKKKYCVHFGAFFKT